MFDLDKIYLTKKCMKKPARVHLLNLSSERHKLYAQLWPKSILLNWPQNFYFWWQRCCLSPSKSVIFFSQHFGYEVPLSYALIFLFKVALRHVWQVMLYILTSVWVLPTQNSGWNLLFYIFAVFFKDFDAQFKKNEAKREFLGC